MQNSIIDSFKNIHLNVSINFANLDNIISKIEKIVNFKISKDPFEVKLYSHLGVFDARLDDV